jgi:hypothetical protein
MNAAYKTLLAGVMALVFCGPALAHGPANPGSYVTIGYGNAGLAGNVTVWGNSAGQTAWSGSLTVGTGPYSYYAPAYVTVAPPPVYRPVYYGPRYYGPRAAGYPRAYRNGYKKGYGRGGRHAKGHHH